MYFFSTFQTQTTTSPPGFAAAMGAELHETKALVSHLYQYNSANFKSRALPYLHGGSARVMLCANFVQVANTYWRSHFGISIPPKRRRVPNTWQKCQIAK